jgi:hypothetical protein
MVVVVVLIVTGAAVAFGALLFALRSPRGYSSGMAKRLAYYDELCSHYGVRRPSLASRAPDVFGLASSGIRRPVRLADDAWEADSRAIASDWQTVGSDLRRSADKVRHG